MCCPRSLSSDVHVSLVFAHGRRSEACGIDEWCRTCVCVCVLTLLMSVGGSVRWPGARLCAALALGNGDASSFQPWPWCLCYGCSSLDHELNISLTFIKSVLDSPPPSLSSSLPVSISLSLMCEHNHLCLSLHRVFLHRCSSPDAVETLVQAWRQFPLYRITLYDPHFAVGFLFSACTCEEQPTIDGPRMQKVHFCVNKFSSPQTQYPERSLFQNPPRSNLLT